MRKNLLAKLGGVASARLSLLASPRLLIASQIGLWAVSSPNMAFATLTLGQVGQAQQATFQGLYTGAEYFVMFLGFMLTALGIMKWISDHKKHESPAAGIAMMIAGILLLSIDAFISMGSATVFGGTDQSTLSTLQ